MNFSFNQLEALSFFGVLTRTSVLVAVLPFYGDRTIPGPVKILLALALSMLLFPVLVTQGRIVPEDALQWASTTYGLASTVFSEVAVGIVLGFSAKLIFDSIQMGSELMGNFMGFAMATQYDPHAETQTEVISKFHMALAMLLFLAVDGHHMLLQAALESYRFIGLGQATLTSGSVQTDLISLSSQGLRIAMQLAAPMALSIFAVNVVYGVMSKAVPQMNILILSLGISALIGLFVMFASLPGFFDVTRGMFVRMGEAVQTVTVSLAGSR
jgi:flagellar biosynthetic protein FliR